jgi:hypothetical protein
VTPTPIPKSVPDPSDPAPFTDNLTITTNALLDTPHKVSLVMQARGAIISDTPLATTWTFGTIGAGSIGTFTSTIRNTGNAPALVELEGLGLSSIFGVRNNPTTAVANGVASIVGQFTPPSSNGSWSDQATLSVTAADAFCAPLPTQWNRPTVTLSGSSDSSRPVTVAGSLAFPSTDCGNAAPAGQGVTLTNNTNIAYAYTVSFNSGRYYSILDPGTGTLAANGTAAIAVVPRTITPALGVEPGSTPYADDLLLTVQSSGSDGGTPPVATFTIPTSWTLNGAVLSLPEGAGPNGNSFYPADSTGGFTLPMSNSGTASATVSFAIQPSGAFAFSPSPPIQVIPGIGATPGLVSTPASAACPTTTNGTATFVYAGPVCQPFHTGDVAYPMVNVRACQGAFP